MTLPLAPPAVQTDGVVVLNCTGRPLEAVAVTVTGDWARVRFGNVAKVMVCATRATVKLRLTAVAALYVALPAWSARMVHVPAATSVTELPFAPPVVQTVGVVLVNETTSPLDAVAVTATGDSAKVFLVIDGNVIVLASFDTVKFRFTGVAAAYTLLPACSARTVHVPASSSAIEEPFGPVAEQTAGVVVVKVTTNPLDEVALTLTGDWSIVRADKAANVIDCVALVTVKVRARSVAGAHVASPAC